MPRKRPDTRETLAENLAFLLEERDWSYRDLADKAGLAHKTVGNIINKVSAASIETVQKIAEQFGLEGWHLIMPTLISDLTSSTSIRKLYTSYSKANEAGRRHIERIAEREAEYSIYDEDDPDPDLRAS